MACSVQGTPKTARKVNSKVKSMLYSPETFFCFWYSFLFEAE
jgi:hypothetical protein